MKVFFITPKSHCYSLPGIYILKVYQFGKHNFLPSPVSPIEMSVVHKKMRKRFILSDL